MDCVKFKVNGVECSVGNDVSSTTSLLEYLRRHLELRGTKYMCLEGGCGACIVSAVKCPGQAPQSVNACLVSVTSCQGWDITTIEQVGNRLKGYHPLQTTLAEYNGTQCGFCTPGWVMSMYSLLKSEPNLTMLDVERSLSSNLCRCTGYRPIFDAFKKFASDAAGRIELPDIEELCKNTKDTCLGRDCKDYDWCFVSNNDLEDSILYIELKDGRQWFRVQTVADILQVLRTKGVDSYMLVAGNTGKGAYPIIENPRILIDISGVSEIRGFNFDQNLVVGAGSTLSEFIQILQEASDTENFEYLKIINEHIQFVAHVAVRNIGTIAGNLMIKHAHREFPSDIFLLLETIGARLTIISVDGTKKIVTMANFLAEDMKGKVILNVLMPPFSKENKVVTYKVAARSRNAHAIVNAGFFYKIKPDNRVADCRIVYGDLSPNFNRASKTEKFLVGKILFNNDTLQKAMKMLSDELIVTELPPEPSAKYRRKLALVLFYKGLLSLCPENILNPRYRSGAIKLPETRPVSTASQSFTTDPTVWPINQPLPKAEALLQCAGEAKYTEDIPKLPNEVFAAFVLSTVALGTITSIDATEALQQEGVIAFYIAKDIPGLNSFTSPDLTEFTVNEEILCSKEVQYYNQPIGIIVADTFHLADRATLMDCLKDCQKEILNKLKIKMRQSNICLRRTLEYFGLITRKDARNIENPWSLGRSKIGVNENGVIQYLNFDLYDDNGFIVNEPLIGLTLDVFSNCYNQEAWTYRSFNVITDTHSNTWIRSPGTLEAISSSEEMMERISYELGIDPLQANAFTDASDVHNFDVYGVTLAEVEVDVLTGQFQITRVDLLEDVGRSVNPDIDIGQVEGAFIMGVGYFTSEETIFDRKTGELLTDRTWNYFVPGGTDIPQDLRIYFRKKSYSNDAILGSKYGPYTVEKIGLACETKLEEFKFY
nr:xanthine dehydrogenase-like [Maniola hyperantus]